MKIQNLSSVSAIGKQISSQFNISWNKSTVFLPVTHKIFKVCHYNDVIMGTMASQITSLTIVYSTVYSGSDQRKHQSSASLAFMRGIHWWPVNSPHKGPVTRKMFPFDDVIMCYVVVILWVLHDSTTLVPEMKPWRIRVKITCTKQQQNTTKHEPCERFLGWGLLKLCSLISP